MLQSKSQQFIIDFRELLVEPNAPILGKGAFGIVYKAKWRGRGKKGRMKEKERER
jgi:hypothetical protein